MLKLEDELALIFANNKLNILTCEGDYALFVVDAISPEAFEKLHFTAKCNDCAVNIDTNLEFGYEGLEIELTKKL